MGIDAELISSEGFNLNLKNYLRDFFTYQFKEKNTDFKQKGNKTECNIFKALSPGNAIITATTSNGIKANCIVRVIQDDRSKHKIEELSLDTVKNPTSISFKTKQLTMKAGDNRKITINVLPKDSAQSIVYFSSDESVAKVVSGKILAIKQGSCEITATTINGLSDRCVVCVSGEEILPNSLDVDFEEIEVRVGEEFRLTAFVKPVTSTNLEIFWSTSDKSIIEVSESSTIGMFLDKMLNKNIVDSKFNYDSGRLRFALEQSAGVSWSKGEIADLSKGQIDKNKANKRVECVTLDGKSITKNPFQELYKCCLEDSTHLGQSFLLTYFLIFHFHLGSALERYDYVPITEKELKKLDDYLIATAVDLESKARRGNVKSWRDFSSKEKKAFGTKSIERLCVEQGEIKKLYDSILFHNRCVVLENDHFVVKNNSLLEPNYVEKNDLFKIYDQYRERYRKKEKIDIKQFGNRLQHLTRLGILKSKKSGDRLYYTLSNVFLNDILGDNEDFRIRFMEMVSFFSQILPLGEVGNFISDRITNKTVQNMRFKHNYLTRTLNDYNIIDLLNAIDQKKWIEIEYRNASIVDLKYQKFVCLPLEIRESVTDGRQYLLFYHPNFRSVSAVRVEFIDSIKIGQITEKSFFQKDLAHAEELIAYTWGTAFDDFKTGNVKKKAKINQVRAIIKCAENEFYIKSRVQRECRNCISINSIIDEKNGHCFELLAELVNFKEFMQWLRSLTCRVVSVEVNGTEYIRLYDDFIRTGKLYNLTSLERLCDDENTLYKKETLTEFKNEFEEFDRLHDMLFNELFSEPFYKVGRVLFDLFKQDIVDKEDIIKTYSKLWDYTVAADRKKQLEFVLDAFIVSAKRKKGGTIWSEYEEVQVTALSFKPNYEIGSMWGLIPLTNIEIQWIQNILCHPLAKCFLTPNEFKKIKYGLPKMNLFDVNKVVLHDQFLDMGSFYARIDFGDTVRTTLQAIREKRAIFMQYKDQYGVCSPLLCYPSHIEYSKRDNKIRIRGVCNGVVQTFNIERIQDVSILEDYFDYNDVTNMIETYDVTTECSIDVFFTEIKNVPDRILTEFSCFRKTCMKWGKDKYRMTLYYKKEEAKEILVRLLSYGPYIMLGENYDAEGHDGAVKTEYLERIERQLELIKSRDIVRETIAKKHLELQR